MGVVVSLADRKAAGPKLRPEPQGYLLVPARILATLKRLEDSVDAMAGDTTHTKHPDWNAFYGIVACLEMSTRYQ